MSATIMKSRSTEKTLKLVYISMFAAVIVVVQTLTTFAWPGVIPMNLSLPVIILGAALFGPKAGAVLGMVFAAIVIWSGVSGQAPTSAIMWNQSPVIMVLSNLFRGAATGIVAGLGFKLMSKKAVNTQALATCIIAPIVNTGLFITTLAVFFRDILGGNTFLEQLVATALTLNFILEMTVNLVMVTVIAIVINATRKNKNF